MNTKDLIEIVRTNVLKARAKERQEWIDGRIGWSRRSAKKSWLTRKFCGLPDHEFTEQEALASLDSDRYVPHFMTVVNWTGMDAIKVCNALEAASANDLPLKLTVKEVEELRRWL